LIRKVQVMRKKISRRLFMSFSSALGVGAASILTRVSRAGAIDANFSQKFTPSEKSFMDQFYEGAAAIVTGIRDTQSENISKAMEKAFELKKKGGTVFSHVVYGHYSMFAGSRDIPGQPWVLPQCGVTPSQTEFDSMKKGDFLITDRVDENTRKVRERGVYVVGITNNYFKFAKTPPGALRPDIMKLSLEEISDLIIDSQVPWDNGLVHAPQISQMALCPSSGICQFAVYWACTASLSNLIGTKGKGSSSEPVKKYLDILLERFTMIGTDRPKIDAISEKWADLVLGKHARILVYGHPQDVEPYNGTRNVFVNDACVCSSSAMIADQYETKANEVRDTDIILIGAFTSDNPQEIAVARRAKEIGAYSAAFCPFSKDGDSSGLRLFKEVDDSINTFSDESTGVIAVPGFEKKVSPVAGLTGDLVLWMLTAQWADHMARRGEMPYFWKGYHENEGREYDNIVQPLFLKRGY
jgi:uncharacterized phosphosugar-binding protein